MAFKLWKSGSYLYMLNLTNANLISGSAGRFEFINTLDDTSRFMLTKDDVNILPYPILYSEFQDIAGVTFDLTTFNAFKETNTGTGGGGGGGGTVIPIPTPVVIKNRIITVTGTILPNQVLNILASSGIGWIASGDAMTSIGATNVLFLSTPEIKILDNSLESVKGDDVIWVSPTQFSMKRILDPTDELIIQTK